MNYKVLVIILCLIFEYQNQELNELCIPLKNFEEDNAELIGNQSLDDFFYSHNVIGKGNTSEVIKLDWKNKKAVIKKINKIKRNSITEIKILKQTSGEEFFTDFYECTYSDAKSPKVYIFFQQLFEELDKNNRQKFLILNSPKERLEIYIQFAKALIILHKKGFIHGDLKPDNIMMTDNTYKSLKLIDFGLTSRIGLPCLGGSPLTNSPEKQKNLFSEAKIEMDIFAFGMTLAIMEIGLVRIMDIFRKSFGFNVSQVLIAMRNKAIKEVGRINPFGFKKPSYFVRFWNYMKSIFVDNRMERIYDFSDLIENNMAIDKVNRLSLESVIEVLKKLKENSTKNITNEDQFVDPDFYDPYQKDIRKALMTSINKDNYVETLDTIEKLMRLESKLHRVATDMTIIL